MKEETRQQIPVEGVHTVNWRHSGKRSGHLTTGYDRNSLKLEQDVLQMQCVCVHAHVCECVCLCVSKGVVQVKTLKCVRGIAVVW